MSDEEFSLPKSGWDVLIQILRGYFHAGNRKSRETVTQGEISNYTGLNPTQIARNTKFLQSIGALEKEGVSLRLTEDGLRLALALDHQDSPSIQKALRTLYKDNEFTNSILSAVRVRDGMDEESLTKHILLSAGAPNKSGPATGARALIESLELAGLLTEDDGSYRFVSHEEQEIPTKTETRSRTTPRTQVSEKEETPQTLPTIGSPLGVSIQVSLDGEDLVDEERLNAVADGIRRLRKLLGERDDDEGADTSGD